MGHSAVKSTTLIGLGVTAISENKSFYLQNSKDLKQYYQMIDDHKLPTIKGHKMKPKDQIIKKIIMNLMCNLSLDVEQLSLIQTDELILKMEKFFALGLLKQKDDIINVTSKGRLFLRNIASEFDHYLIEH